MHEENYVDISQLSIREINKNVAREIIVKNHYTHKWSLCRVAYGVFCKNGKKSDFIDGESETLIGCIVYGQPVGRSAAASLTDLLNIDQVLELTRLFVFDGYGKNIESYVIANSIKLIKRDFPNIKAIISYADGEKNHNGKIYQATNFIYQGCGSVALMPNHSISLAKNPYDWMHSRTVSATYGSHNVEHLKKVIGKTFYRKKESNKHRYVLFIGSKQENRKFIKTLKHPSLPYPKQCDHKDVIEEIIVENKCSNCFFE